MALANEQLKLNFTVRNCQSDYAEVLAWIDTVEGNNGQYELSRDEKLERLDKLVHIQPTYDYKEAKNTRITNLNKFLDTYCNYYATFEISIISDDKNPTAGEETDVVNALYLVMLLWRFRDNYSRVSVRFLLDENQMFRFPPFFKWLPAPMLENLYSDDINRVNPSGHFLPALIVDKETLVLLRSFVEINNESENVFYANNSSAKKYVELANRILRKRFTTGSVSKGIKLAAETLYGQKITVMQFIVFAFIYGKNRNLQKEVSYEIARTELICCVSLSNSICSGILQALENSVFYSTDGVAFFTLRAHYCKPNNSLYAQSQYGYKYAETEKREKTTTPFAVELIAADINWNNTICTHFSGHLEKDKDNETCIKSDEAIRAVNDLLKVCGNLEVSHFFASLEDRDDFSDVDKAWFNYRNALPNLHTGLAVLASEIRKCGGAINVNSGIEFLTGQNSKTRYFEQSFEERLTREIPKMEPKIPGTQMAIFIPISLNNLRSINGIGIQPSGLGYRETYETYAKYINTQMVPVSFEENSEETISDILMKWKNKSGLSDSNLKAYYVDMWKELISRKICEITDDSKIVTIDLDELCEKAAVFSSDYKFDVLETFVRGLADFAQNSYCRRFVAVINANNTFVNALVSRLITVPNARFNENLQMFIHDATTDRPEYRGFVLFGRSFGETLINEGSIGVSRGYQLLNPSGYVKIREKMNLKRNKINSEEIVDLMPFDAILKAPKKLIDTQQAELILYKAMRDMTQRDSDNRESWNINHMRLGSKIHIDRFYNAAPLFTRSDLAGRIAFILLRDLIDKNNNDLSGKFLFYSYAEYSKGILNALDSIIKATIEIKNKEERDDIPDLSNLTYKTAIYQHARRSDTTNEASVCVLSYSPDSKSLPNEKEISEYKLIQIIPISTTFTTFNKTLTRLNNEIRKNKTLDNGEPLPWKQITNITILWVRDERGGPTQPYKIEGDYWNSSDAFKVSLVKENLPELRKYENSMTVSYAFSAPSVWNDPQKCGLCFPDNSRAEEQPLFETDVTSTVPSAQYGDFFKVHKENSDQAETDNNKRIKKLKDCVRYGHYERGGKHYQFYINTVDYFREVSNDVKKWLIGLAKSRSEGVSNIVVPNIVILFAPEHLSNIEFPQYVNNYLFNGFATTIFTRTDSQFRSNFETDNRSVRDSIELFIKENDIDISNINKIRESVRLCYVDDSIITATTFHRANGLIRSILPEYMTKEPIVFDECFVLVNRLSKSSKAGFLREAHTKFHEFVRIDISSMRTLGDACVCCKLEESYQHLLFNSATDRMNAFWIRKLESARNRPFDAVDTQDESEATKESEKAYHRLIATHTVQNMLAGTTEPALGDVVDLFSLKGDFLFAKEMKKNSPVDKRFEILLKVLPRPFISFDTAVKKHILRFFVLLADCILEGDGFVVSIIEQDADKPAMEVIRKYAKDIVDYFGCKNVALFNFFLDCIAEGLCDMKSNYIMRPEIIKRIAVMISGLEEQQDQEEIFFKLAVLIKRLIFTFSDETKSLYLENRLLEDAYNLDYPSGLYNRFLSLLLIENVRVIYDGTKYAEDKNVIKNAYFLNAHESLYKKQYEKLGIQKKNERLGILNQFEEYRENVIKCSCDLFQYIYKDATRRKYLNNEDYNSIKKYSGLLEKISAIIKSALSSDEDVGCALLTRSKSASPDFIAMTHSLSGDGQWIVRSSMDQYTDDNNLNGYYARHQDGKHELVIKFSNSDEISKIRNTLENAAHKGGPRPDELFHRSLRPIEDVFLYIEFLWDTNIDNKKCEYVDNMVARLILQHRQSLMRMFEADFTNSALSELTDKNKKSLILSSARAETHDDAFFENLLKTANVSVDKAGRYTWGGWVQLLVFINSRVASLFRIMVADNEVPNRKRPGYFDGSDHIEERSALGNMLSWCLSLVNDMEYDSNYGSQHIHFDEFFNKFKIMDQNYNDIGCSECFNYLCSFMLISVGSTGKERPLNHGWLFPVIMSCFISAVKYGIQSNNSRGLKDKDILDYFYSTQENHVCIRIYQEDSDGQTNMDDVSYLVLENDTNWFFGDKEPIEGKTAGTENLDKRCKEANRKLKIKLNSPTSVSLDNGHGFSLAICHYYCKKALVSRNENRAKKDGGRDQSSYKEFDRFALYEKKKDFENKYVFKIRLPILIKKENKK